MAESCRALTPLSAFSTPAIAANTRYQPTNDRESPQVPDPRPGCPASLCGIRRITGRFERIAALQARQQNLTAAEGASRDSPSTLLGMHLA